MIEIIRMRQVLFLIFSAFILTNCAKVETVSNDEIRSNSNKTNLFSPTIKTNTFLKPVTPKIRITAKQKKYLNESLPPKVREILEKAEKFEILNEELGRNTGNEGTTFEPNHIAEIVNEADKKEILESIYQDASIIESPADCYEPHHGIRAIYQDKTIEIEICFSCAKFNVKGSAGNFSGTIVRGNRKSEDVFDRIIKYQSVEIR